MKLSTSWQGKMRFEATDGTNVTVMDAPPPFGEGRALSPKQLCLASICGCTAIDIVSWLKKKRQEPTSLKVDADAPITKGYPAVFAHVTLDFYAEGAVEPAALIDAVDQSQTLYCGVSAMIAKACPVKFRVHLNGQEIHAGEAAFPEAQ